MSIFIGSSLSMALYALECNNTLETCRGNSGNFLIKMPPDIGWCRNGKIEMWTKVSFVFLYVCMFIFFCILNGNLIHEKNLLEWSQFGLEISFRIMKLFNIRDISLIELYWIFSIKYKLFHKNSNSKPRNGMWSDIVKKWRFFLFVFGKIFVPVKF